MDRDGCNFFPPKHWRPASGTFGVGGMMRQTCQPPITLTIMIHTRVASSVLLLLGLSLPDRSFGGHHDYSHLDTCGQHHSTHANRRGQTNSPIPRQTSPSLPAPRYYLTQPAISKKSRGSCLQCRHLLVCQPIVRFRVFKSHTSSLPAKRTRLTVLDNPKHVIGPLVGEAD